MAGVALFFVSEFVLSQTVDSASRMTMLFFGDVNLGRNLGQELLKGNVDYPFERMKSTLRSADCVFVNLESPIVDQNGETESPKSNFIFCAPPVAGFVLKNAGVTIVSTANNHAYDYLQRGISETIQTLDRDKILHVGTSVDSVDRIPPVIIRHGGIAVGFLAYTQFVNAAGAWEGRIALFDSIQARKDIRLLKQKSDFVVVSFHGGIEYSDEPNKKTKQQMESLVRAGADVVIGHHPHVPQGVEILDGKFVFFSLGNFVFNQATPWAKRSYGVELKIVKLHKDLNIASIRLIPIRAYKQPSTDLLRADVDSLIARVQKLSNASIVPRNDSLFVTSLHLGYPR